MVRIRSQLINLPLLHDRLVMFARVGGDQCGLARKLERVYDVFKGWLCDFLDTYRMKALMMGEGGSDKELESSGALVPGIMNPAG